MKNLEYSLVLYCTVEASITFSLKYHDDKLFKNICLVSLSLCTLERSATLSGEMQFLDAVLSSSVLYYVITRTKKEKVALSLFVWIAKNRSRFAKNIEKYYIC
jgi:hypothetical protein